MKTVTVPPLSENHDKMGHRILLDFLFFNFRIYAALQYRNSVAISGMIDQPCKIITLHFACRKQAKGASNRIVHQYVNLFKRICFHLFVCLYRGLYLTSLSWPISHMASTSSVVPISHISIAAYISHGQHKQYG